jgi:hypothetical protein
MIRLQAKTKEDANKPSGLDRGQNPSNDGVSPVVNLDPTLTDSRSAATATATYEQEKEPSKDGLFRSKKVDHRLTDPMPEPPRPVPMWPGDVWNIKQAAHFAHCHPKTVRRWVKKHGIGRQAGRNARLEISQIALQMVLQGDMEALGILRSGDRNHPRVLFYIKWLTPA